MKSEEERQLEKQEELENRWERFVDIHRTRTAAFLLTVWGTGSVYGISMYALVVFADRQARAIGLFDRVELFYVLFLSFPFGLGMGYATSAVLWLWLTGKK